jgi:hypothetical protein
MLQIEIAEKIKGLWPASTPDQISALMKNFSDIDPAKLVEILEDVWNTTKFKTIQSDEITRRVRMSGLTGYTNGRYIDVWGVDLDGKYKMCSCLAQNEEGARVQMGKYLLKHNHDPTDYTLFTDFISFWQYRMKCNGLESKVNK